MNEINNRLSKPPYMMSSKKASASDGELAAFYVKLREYYSNLHFDKAQVAKEQHYYEKVARITRLFARLKGTTLLHKERVNDSPAMIYTANHLGSYDQFYISSMLDKFHLHYLVKDKVTTWPIRWNLIYKPTGVVVVEVGNLKSWNQAKAKLIQYILHGHKVFIFAEGSRRGENNMGDFNPGIAQIVQETGVKIGTLAMKNTSKLFSRKPVICVGETISIDPREDLKIATGRIQSSVINAYNEILTYECERK
jgi:1-acyl-sn-glycerol-3-phosphate acyltransferase